MGSIDAKPEYYYGDMENFRKWFSAGLTIEQYNFYNSDKKYTWSDMKIIKYGLVRNLATDEMELISNKDFDIEHRKNLFTAFSWNISAKQLEKYMHLSNNWYKLEECLCGIYDNFTDEKMDLLTNIKYNWDELQMREIRLGFDDNLTMEQVLTYAKPEQMCELRRALCKKDFSIEHIKSYAKPEYSAIQIRMNCTLYKPE